MFALHLVPHLTYSAGSAREGGSCQPGLSTLKPLEHPATGLQGEGTEAHSPRQMPDARRGRRPCRVHRETQSNLVHLGLGINHLPNTY